MTIALQTALKLADRVREFLRTAPGDIESPENAARLADMSDALESQLECLSDVDYRTFTAIQADGERC